jgi:CHAT domain-containing protein/Tfp pilus assembly protein PilF
MARSHVARDLKGTRVARTCVRTGCPSGGIATVLVACCLCAFGAGYAEASTPSAQTRSSGSSVAQRIRAAIDGNQIPAAQELAREIIGALSAATTPKSEQIAVLAPTLLRFLLDSGDSEGAKKLAEATLEARRRAGRGGDALEASLVNAVGEASFEAGDAQGALEKFEKSLKIRERALGRAHPLVAESLNNRGVVEQSLGRYKAARMDFELSLAIRERTLPPGHKDIAESINALAVLNLATGDYAKAEAWFKRAMALRERDPGPDSLATAESISNLAELYRQIGDTQRSLPLGERALAIRIARLGGDHILVAESLNNLAILHSRDEPAAAEVEYRRAIAIYRKSGSSRHATVATLENNLGMLLLHAGRFDEAKEFLSSALASRRELLGPDHPLTARSLDNLAKLYIARGDFAGAETLLAEALPVVEAADDPDSRWRVQDTARRLESARGNRPEAIVYGKRAVNGLQALRLNLRSLDTVLQQTFLKDKGETYRALFDLLVAEGRLAEAAQILLMMKEEEYFDFIQRSASNDPRATQAMLTPMEAEGAARLERASADVVKLIRERAALLAKERREDAEEARLQQLNDLRRAAIRAFNDALGEIHQFFSSAAATQARAKEIGAMNLESLKSLQGTLETLGEGVVAVHYVVLDNKIRILLTTAQAQVARESEIDAALLSRRIQRFREALQDPQSNPLPHARELYRLLIEPVARDLEQAGARTLMLSLDGALRYLPFAALNDGNAYLVEKYRLALFSEAARDKLKDPPFPDWKAAALGMTQSAEGFVALPSVAEELHGIVRTAESMGGILPGRIALDKAFSRTSVIRALSDGFPVIHIASHFVFNPGTELESFLLLGDKSHLSLKEIKDEDYDFRHVELVALSACETAIGGGADHFGREIEGFAAMVQKQGARSVIATLWQVADESTAVLMKVFYANHSFGKFTKAEALRQAQLTLLRGDLDSDEAAPATQRAAVRSAVSISAPVTKKQYAHPYYWAPFIIAGNWL